MQNTRDRTWQTTQFSGTSRMLRYAGAALFLTFVVIVTFFAGGELIQTPIGAVVLTALAAVAVYDFRFILKRGLRWNDESIAQTGTLLDARVHRWSDLTAVEPSMRKRATILTFGATRKVILYWGFEAYHEVFDLAERKLENARTS